MVLATTSRYDSGNVAERGGRAVVVGASVGGSLAARVLSDGFDEVTVFDRGPLPDEPVARQGVPQAEHAHLLLEGGRVAIEDLLPEYSAELVSAGGVCLDGETDVRQYVRGGFLADGTRQRPMYTASRGLFEQRIRTRVADLPGVTVREECLFVDYLTGENGAVEGVRVREDGTERDLRAQLVVDATGRTSRTPDWLAAQGYGSPPVDEVHVDISYSTARFERADDEEWALSMLPDAPRKRGWAALPIEDGEWIVGLSGMHGTGTPTDREGFERFLAAMPTDDGRQFVETHEWATDEIHTYPFPSSVRRRYEALDRFPTGLVVLGDAIASFNPIYGQGMSVAALEALVLHDCLADGYRSGVAPEFFQRVEPTVDAAWQLAVGSDFGFEATEGPKPAGLALTGRYLDRLLRKAHTDHRLRTAFQRVATLEEAPSSLFRPGIVGRVLRPEFPDLR